MRLLILSDTHDNFLSVFQAVEQAGPVDLILHLGDGENDVGILSATLINTRMSSVRGNCDLQGVAPREHVLDLEGKRFLLSHGDVYGVKNGLERLEQRAREVNADAVLYGHTHVALIEYRSGMVFINPGTLMKGSLRQTFALVSILPHGLQADIFDIA